VRGQWDNKEGSTHLYMAIYYPAPPLPPILVHGVRNLVIGDMRRQSDRPDMEGMNSVMRVG
jgi:hypothetical protein